MPKDTFNNLSAEKKRIIFDAAVQEFSTRRFSEASINQIIKTAGISRGSFYQYFNDKEDIYLYMIMEIGKEKLEVLSHTEALNPDADFFENFLHMTRVALTWAKTKPDYNQVGLLMELDDSEFIAKLRALSTEGLAIIKGMVERDKQRGLIRQEINSDLVVEMMYTLNINLLKDIYRNGSEEEMLKKMADMYDIIKGGIARV
ncbi:MAG: TetR/AcrR family transcriptional regulator [Clostridiales bacterium]|nr:TetR/AcrR family transcriptional regulator [Clostridiales bacterium]